MTRAVVYPGYGAADNPQAAQHMFDQFTGGILPMPPRGMDSACHGGRVMELCGEIFVDTKEGGERPSRSDCRWSDGGVALCCQWNERGGNGWENGGRKRPPTEKRQQEDGAWRGKEIRTGRRGAAT